MKENFLCHLVLLLPENVNKRSTDVAIVIKGLIKQCQSFKTAAAGSIRDRDAPVKPTSSVRI